MSERDVLEALRTFGAPFRRCAEVARWLNRESPCPWCPVGPPLPSLRDPLPMLFQWESP